MQFAKKYLSRRWITHLIGLGAVIGLGLNGVLESQHIVTGIVLVVASEGGTNVADYLVAVLDQNRKGE